MPIPGIRAATSFLDEMQRDLLETEDQHLDGFFDRWTAAGLPEIEEYRGDRIRSRGEMISETTKIGRAIEKRPELLQEEDTAESPILTGVKRIARGTGRFQGLMANSGAVAPTLMQASSPAAATDFSPAPPDFEAETGNSARLDGDFATGDRVDPAPTAAPFAAEGNVNALAGFAPVAGTVAVEPDGLATEGDAFLSTELAAPDSLALTPPGQFDGEEEFFLGSLIPEAELVRPEQRLSR